MKGSLHKELSLRTAAEDPTRDEQALRPKGACAIAAHAQLHRHLNKRDGGKSECLLQTVKTTDSKKGGSVGK